MSEKRAENAADLLHLASLCIQKLRREDQIKTGKNKKDYAYKMVSYSKVYQKHNSLNSFS